MSGDSQKILQFAGFTLDPNSASLSGTSGPLPLRPKAFDVLAYLIRHPGRVVTKDELIEAVWPDVFVTDNSLVQCISDIRAALQDDAQQVLKTIARRGYLFAAPVTELQPSLSPMPAAIAAPVDVSPGRQAPLPVQAGRKRAWQAALALVAIAGVGTAWWSWPTRPAEEAASSAPADAATVAAPALGSNRVAIAFLPLVDLGGPGDDAYFVDGLTEDIIAALGRFADLSVRAPNAVFAYRGKTLRPEDIGRELKVRYIAEGSVRRSADRLRIAIRLTDAANGTLLWADQYDAERDQIFAIQDNITRHITGALAVRLTNVEQARAAAKPPSSLEAYDLVLRGRDFLARLSRASNSNARALFEQAAVLDPGYAGAYVGLGRVELAAVAIGWTADPAGALQRAESLGRKAIAIDEFDPAAHVLLGRAYVRLREYDRALDQLKAAVALNPSDPNSYAGLGDAMLWIGDIAGAIEALEVAVNLDPKLSTEDLFGLGTAYFLAGRHTDAIRTFERPIARNDANAFIYLMLAATYAEDGRVEQAGRAAAEARRLYPFFDLENFGTLFRNPEHRGKIIAALQKVGF
jgi:TolB-like protein/DNA-binding winged helix-turn-helix (wHTH) protein/cytochrome c-type biogenesis protein CcmH/NrfG